MFAAGRIGPDAWGKPRLELRALSRALEGLCPDSPPMPIGLVTYVICDCHDRLTVERRNLPRRATQRIYTDARD